MICMRARFLALFVLALPAIPSWAATIAVTTPFDIVADNDELCSIREAVKASLLAQDLNGRNSAKRGFETISGLLAKGLLDIQLDPENVTYPRVDMLGHVQDMQDEVAALKQLYVDGALSGSTAAAELAIVNVLVDDVKAYQDKVLALGVSSGTFDGAGNSYPAAPALGSYFYSGSAQVTILNVLNLDPELCSAPNAPVQQCLTYEPGDYALWDGTNWSHHEIRPADVNERGMQEAIALLARVQASVTTAITAFRARTDADGCTDGTAFDVIRLEEESRYFLNNEIELPLRVTLRGGSNTVIERCDPVAPQMAGTPPASCLAMSSLPVISHHRLINVPQTGNLELINVALKRGSAGNSVGDNGGAIVTAGSMSAANVRFEGNSAHRGGAIFLTETGALSLERGWFIDNSAVADGGAIYNLGRSLRLTEFQFGECVATENSCSNHGNVAGANGGAIFMRPTEQGALQLMQGAFIGNSADRGSAIYVSGVAVDVMIENTTISQNHALSAATIDVAVPLMDDGELLINNVTMVRNTAVVGGAGVVMNPRIDFFVRNSVLAENTGGGAPGLWDCDLPSVLVGGVMTPTVPADNFSRNYFSFNSFCPGLRFGSPASVPEKENFELVDPSLPADPADLNFSLDELLLPMDPAVGPHYVPTFPSDPNNSLENRLVNRGAGSQEVARCAEKDQRGYGRSSSVDETCDIGAVEYQIGRRMDDLVDDLLVNDARCLNVIANDLGDALYVPGSLVVDPRSIERAGATAVVVNRMANPTACTWSDIPYDEAILFTPPPGFRGETSFVYQFGWRTADPAVVPAAASGSVTAIVRVQTESRGALTSYGIGGLSPMLLLCSLLIGLRRRLAHFGVLILAFALLSMPAHAAEVVIYVNSGLDEPGGTTPGDGRCTLREALNTARNDQANMTGGDCLNGNEGPDIIEFLPSVTEVVLEGTLIAYGGVTLRCPTPPPLEDEATSPAPTQTCTIRRRETVPDAGGLPVPNTNQFRLIDSRGTLTVNRMILEGGQTPDANPGIDGGAIYSTGSVTIFNSVFRNNSAVNGGAIFLAGTTSALSISGTVFEGNTSRAGMRILGGLPATDVIAGTPVRLSPETVAACPQLARGGSTDRQVGTRLGGGGAIASTQSDSHRINIVATTFKNNCSVAGGAAVDMNSRSPVVIANTTFSGNVSTEGPVIDVSGTLNGVMLRNVTVVNNFAGLAKDYEAWETVGGSLQRAAVQFGQSSGTLTSSIIAANYTEADRVTAANCGSYRPSFSRMFNVFGDDDDPMPTLGSNTSDLGETGFTCSTVRVDDRDPNVGNSMLTAEMVFDPTNPTSSGLLRSLEDIQAGDVKLPMHVIADPSSAAGILVDAGYIDFEKPAPVENQVDPAGAFSSAKCANVDARGASRTSGGRCDVGAFEVLRVTATADSFSNNGRQDRLVMMDVIVNDIVDAAVVGGDAKKDCDALEVLPGAPVAGARTYRYVKGADVCSELIVPSGESGVVSVLRKDKLADLHKIRSIPTDKQILVSMIPANYLNGRFPDDFVAGWDRQSFLTPAEAQADASRLAREFAVTESMLAPGYVFVYDNNGVIRDKLRDGFISLQYRLYTEGQDVSNLVGIELSVDNVPPSIVGETIRLGLGASSTIDVLGNDSDADLTSGTALKIISISGGGCRAVPDPLDLQRTLYWQCQFGRVTLNPAQTGLFWEPDNAFNPFAQEILYEVSDGDPVLTKSGKATLRIEVNRSDVSAGGLFGDDDLSDILGIDFLGAPGGVFFVLVLMGAARRRG